ncbi:MAG: hypothetical protein HOM21_16590 [Halobacteriovoraceae bacterium]|nr:hypothetical protein [Halobacteriovoraceae bacterium]
MFRFKYIFNLVLTFCLLNMQFAGTIADLQLTANDASALTRDDTDGSERDERMTEEELAASTEQQQAESGEISGKTSPKGETNYMTEQYISLIVMLMVAVFGVMMAKACAPWVIDMKVATAGAVIFLLGEVAAIFMAKEEIDHSGKSYKISKEGGVNEDGVNENEDQAQALEKEKEGYEAVEKNAKMRGALQAAAAVAFYTAGGIAVYTRTRLEGEFLTCAATINTQIGTTEGVAKACTATCITGCLATYACPNPLSAVACAACTPQCTSACEMQGKTCQALLSEKDAKLGKYNIDGKQAYTSKLKWILGQTDAAMLFADKATDALVCPIPAPGAATAAKAKGVAEETKIVANDATKETAKATALALHAQEAANVATAAATGLRAKLKARGAQLKARLLAYKAKRIASKTAKLATSITAEVLVTFPYVMAAFKTFQPIMPATIAPCDLYILDEEKEKVACEPAAMLVESNGLKDILAPKNYKDGRQPARKYAQLMNNNMMGKILSQDIKKEFEKQGFEELKSDFNTNLNFGQIMGRKISSLNPVDDYFNYYEKHQFISGKKRSLSLSKYYEFKDAFSHIPGQENVSNGPTSIVSILKSTLMSGAEKGIDLIFPKAEAFNVRGLGIAAVGIALVVLLIAGTAPSWDTFMGEPGGRAVIYFIMAVLSTAASFMSFKAAKDAADNIKELDRIIKKLRGFKDGTQTVATNGGGFQNLPISSIIGLNNSQPFGIGEDGTGKFPCAATDSKGQCKRIAAIGNDVQFRGLPGALQGPALAASRLADSIQGSNSLTGSGFQDAENLGQQLARSRDTFNKLLDQNNKLAGNNNQVPLALKARASGLLNSLKANVLKALKKNGTSPSKAVAGIFGGGTRGISADIQDDNEALTAAPGPNNNIKGASASFSTPKIPSFDFKLEDEKNSAGDGISDGKLGDAAGIEEYEGAEGNDIIDAENANIFEIIHIRYLKSAYPRLLDEEANN